ncbi:MAG: hypothetical protein AB7U97_02905, partial [Pirellulales bacterium]
MSGIARKGDNLIEVDGKLVYLDDVYEVVIAGTVAVPTGTFEVTRVANTFCDTFPSKLTCAWQGSGVLFLLSFVNLGSSCCTNMWVQSGTSFPSVAQFYYTNNSGAAPEDTDGLCGPEFELPITLPWHLQSALCSGYLSAFKNT